MKVTRNAITRIANPYKKRKPRNDTDESESESDSNSNSKQTRKLRSKAKIVSPESKEKVKFRANVTTKEKQLPSQKFESPQKVVSDVETSHDESKDEEEKTIGTLNFNQNYLLNNLLSVKLISYIMYKSN